MEISALLNKAICEQHGTVSFGLFFFIVGCSLHVGILLQLQTKMLMGEVMREAAFSLAEAKFTAGDFR